MDLKFEAEASTRPVRKIYTPDPVAGSSVSCVALGRSFGVTSCLVVAPACARLPLRTFRVWGGAVRGRGRRFGRLHRNSYLGQRKTLLFPPNRLGCGLRSEGESVARRRRSVVTCAGVPKFKETLFTPMGTFATPAVGSRSSFDCAGPWPLRTQ